MVVSKRIVPLCEGLPLNFELMSWYIEAKKKGNYKFSPEYVYIYYFYCSKKQNQVIPFYEANNDFNRIRLNLRILRHEEAKSDDTLYGSYLENLPI